MIFIVCQRVILIYFSAKPEMVAHLRWHDRFFVMYRDNFHKPHESLKNVPHVQYLVKEYEINKTINLMDNANALPTI